MGVQIFKMKNLGKSLKALKGSPDIDNMHLSPYVECVHSRIRKLACVPLPMILEQAAPATEGKYNYEKNETGAQGPNYLILKTLDTDTEVGLLYSSSPKPLQYY